MGLSIADVRLIEGVRQVQLDWADVVPDSLASLERRHYRR